MYFGIAIILEAALKGNCINLFKDTKKIKFLSFSYQLDKPKPLLLFSSCLHKEQGLIVARLI
jgi:hypothetical protein